MSSHEIETAVLDEWFVACIGGELSAVQRIVSTFSDNGGESLDLLSALNKKDDTAGRNGLHYAAWKGHSDVVAFLLTLTPRERVDIKDDRWSQTALLWACFEGHLDCVKLLLQAGASPRAADVYLSGLLHASIASGNDDLLEFILSLDPKTLHRPHSETTWQLYDEATETVRIYQQLRWDDALNAADVDGYTPLMVACRSSVRCVESLLKHGANPNIKAPFPAQHQPPADYVGVRTVMHMAADHGNTALVQFYLSLPSETFDFSLLEAETGGHTALSLARFNGHVETAAALLNAGANPTGGQNTLVSMRNRAAEQAMLNGFYGQMRIVLERHLVPGVSDLVIDFIGRLNI